MVELGARMASRNEDLLALIKLDGPTRAALIKSTRDRG